MENQKEYECEVEECKLVKITKMLSEHYTTEEAAKWLSMKQPQLCGTHGMSIPLDLIAVGRADEVIEVLERLDSGVYL